MKTYTILPIIALFLIIFAMNDKLLSFPYLLKTIPALILILTSVVLIVKEFKDKKATMQKEQGKSIKK